MLFVARKSCFLGKCVYEIAEHNHFVQGVAWDPLNEYIATQSSDRSVHVYNISTKQGNFEVHAVGKNTRLPHHHTRTPSLGGRPRMHRRESNTSDAESVLSEQHTRDDAYASSTSGSAAPLTPATSVASTPSFMFPPPPVDKPSSRRSSFSGSNAPSSPSHYSRFGRSPSPMPALPAIRTLPSAAATWSSVKLYGDESFTNFFRRLTFSPDGGLLLTPAGQFEDPSVIPRTSRSSTGNKSDEQPSRGRKNRPSISINDAVNPASASSVYIYSRANFARPPIAQLPGHKKASVAVRFSPVLYELRSSVNGSDSMHETKTATLEKGKEGAMNIDVVGTRPTFSPSSQENASLQRRPSLTPSTASIVSPRPLIAGATGNTLSTTEFSQAPTPAPSKPATPVSVPPSTASVFALPYRMLFAVVTMDTVAIYDTQQTGPVCLLTKLHYDEFTDMTWCAQPCNPVHFTLANPYGCRSPDGQCLILSSRDGYCTIVVFDEIFPAHHTQQHALQLQSIAQHHSVALTYSSTGATPVVTPSITSASLPPTPTVPTKRSEPPPTPAMSVETTGRSVSDVSKNGEDSGAADQKPDEPPKKKRRVALTRVGDLDPSL